MSDADHHEISEPAVDWAVFVPSVIIVLFCAIPLVVFPNSTP